MIRAELGGSGAVTFPDSTTRTLTGVASGPIVLPTNFHGKSGAGGSDSTPGAVNWGNISGTDSASNSAQTISGINVPILLRVTFSSVSGSAAGSLFVSGNTGGGSASGAIGEGTYFEFWAVSGDSVSFSCSVVGTPGQTLACTVTITNRSDAGTPSLDTFTGSMTVGS